MQFLVQGRDGKDEGASARREKAKPAHIAMVNKMMAEGSLWYGASMNDAEGNVIGSICIVDFADKQALLEWLKVEPYKAGGVWKKVEVTSCSTREPWQFNRPKEFYEGRK